MPREMDKGDEEKTSNLIDVGDADEKATEIDLENLIPRLLAISENKRDTKIFIRADKILS